MKTRKAITLLFISSALLTSCNNEPKKALLANSNLTLYGSLDGTELLQGCYLEEFNNLYNSDLNFIIVFSEKGCSACEAFAPILEQYIKETNTYVLNITPNQQDICEAYKDKFFPNSGILTPSVFVKEKGDTIYNVDYAQYMKTYRVFKRHMDSRYKTSKCAYFCDEIPGKSRINLNYSTITFQANNVFKNKISPRLMDTEKDVVIEYNSESNFLYHFEANSKGEIVETRKDKIDENLTDEIINYYI